MTPDDPAIRRRALDDDLARKAAWTRALSARADHNGQISAKGYTEAKVEAGIEAPPPAAAPEPTGPEPTPPGDGGAVERGSPPPPGTALDQQILEAERAGDHMRAITLKNQRLLEIKNRMEGR